VIFDPHMHIGTFPMFDVSLDPAGLQELFEKFDYEGGIVFHPDNEMVREAVEQIPNAWALYWANPRIEPDPAAAAAYLDHPKFLGVKLHPLLDAYLPADPSVRPMVDLAVERDVPILIHSGHEPFSLPWSIEELAVAAPDSKIVMAHMGHGNIVYINAAVDIAERRPNVWLETSGMPSHTKVATAARRIGLERILYGSDAPFHDPGSEIRKIEASGLAPDEVRQVLSDNPRKLFLGDRSPSLQASEATTSQPAA
jgi:predicted TIM-barrel fold metal-dependent hydrolase